MKKISEQTYLEKIEAIEKTIKEGNKGLIIEVQESTNTLYFKKPSTYGEKKGIVITVKINSPDGETFSQWMSIPEQAIGYENSNMYLFSKKYGKPPQKGVEVDVSFNDNGFYCIRF